MILALYLAACSQEPASAAPLDVSAPARRTAGPKAVRHRPTIELTGSLEPIASVHLGFDVGGRIDTLFVTRGEAVTAGQALARLDTALASAQLAQAEAALRGAEAQAAGGEASFARAVKLKEAGAVSEQQFSDADAGIKAARAGIEQAKAAVQMARTNLGLHTLRAPIAGIVTNGPDNVGMLVGPGTPLFVVEDLSALQLKATAPESASWIREGQEVTVLPGTPGATGGFTAKVARVIPSLDPATRRVPVEIRIENPDVSLRAHAFARVTIAATEERDAWSVPRAAIVARPDFSVFVVGAGEPTRVPVDILSDAGADAIVAGNLAAGDTIVLDPPITLGAG